MAGVIPESELRRAAGTKSWSDLRRTFGGTEYQCITAGDADKSVASKLRGHGIRCRFLSNNVFVHAEDFERACDLM